MEVCLSALPEPLPTVTVHTSRTLMLAELGTLFESVPLEGGLVDYRNAVLEDNVLLKGTFAGRQKTFLNLRRLYGLEVTRPLFAVLRLLWGQGVSGRPLLALLAACAVDEILLATAPVILGTKENERVAHEAMSNLVAETFPNRYGPKTLEAIGQRTASSWSQSGHLHGKLRKVRRRAAATPETIAFALLIGTLQGERGHKLFSTTSVQLLDASPSEHEVLAFTGAQRGYYKYRRLGDVAEVDFSGLLTRTEAPRV